MARAERLLRAFVVVACGWETVAITTGRVPTISAMSWSLVSTRRGRLVVWFGLGVLAWHLLGVGPLARPREWDGWYESCTPPPMSARNRRSQAGRCGPAKPRTAVRFRPPPPSL